MARKNKTFTNEFFLGSALGLLIGTFLPDGFNPFIIIKNKIGL